jgi:hypothetical protein
MSGRTILAIVAGLLWVASPLLFFKRDIQRWWRTRDVRRAREREDARAKAAEEVRVRDELAAKYGLPTTPHTPESSG